MMNSKEILNLLYAKLGICTGDALVYDAELRQTDPWSQEYKNLAAKYNTANDQRLCLEELIDIIEGSEDTSN